MHHSDKHKTHPLKFSVIKCSGEESGHPVTELQYYTDNTKGWLSPRFCDYPQEIVLQFHHHCRISAIQVLSHESKIPNKLELYISDGRNADTTTLQWSRLGFFTLGDNEDTQWQARELKTVDVNGQLRFMKVRILGCHINRENMFNQVGLIALKVLGKKISGGGARNEINEDKHEAKSKSYKERIIEELPPELDEKTRQIIFDIIELKDKAVRQEDFAGAKGLRDAELAMKRDANRLIAMRKEKQACVEAENYERAHYCKEEVEKLEKGILSTARSKRGYRLIEKRRLALKAAKATKFGSIANKGRWGFNDNQPAVDNGAVPVGAEKSASK